jgi:hypothetical protein
MRERGCQVETTGKQRDSCLLERAEGNVCHALAGAKLFTAHGELSA